MRRLKRSLIFLTVTVMLCGSLLSFATAYANEAVNETEPLISEPITDVPAVASVGASEIESGKIYRIKNANSGLYLDVADGGSSNGTNVQQYTFNGSTAQKYKIVSAGDGYYKLLTGCSYTSHSNIISKLPFHRRRKHCNYIFAC